MIIENLTIPVSQSAAIVGSLIATGDFFGCRTAWLHRRFVGIRLHTPDCSRQADVGSKLLNAVSVPRDICRLCGNCLTVAATKGG